MATTNVTQKYEFPGQEGEGGLSDVFAGAPGHCTGAADGETSARHGTVGDRRGHGSDDAQDDNEQSDRKP